jgi:hypothetical protein
MFLARGSCEIKCVVHPRRRRGFLVQPSHALFTSTATSFYRSTPLIQEMAALPESLTKVLDEGIRALYALQPFFDPTVVLGTSYIAGDSNLFAQAVLTR